MRSSTKSWSLGVRWVVMSPFANLQHLAAKQLRPCFTVRELLVALAASKLCVCSFSAAEEWAKKPSMYEIFQSLWKQTAFSFSYEISGACRGMSSLSKVSKSLIASSCLFTFLNQSILHAASQKTIHYVSVAKWNYSATWSNLLAKFGTDSVEICGVRSLSQLWPEWIVVTSEMWRFLGWKTTPAW